MDAAIDKAGGVPALARVFGVKDNTPNEWLMRLRQHGHLSRDKRTRLENYLNDSARSVPPAPRDGSRQPIPGMEDIVENNDLREAWARIHRLWVLGKKHPNRKAAKLWSHLLFQSETLLENAERDVPPGDRRRDRTAGDTE